MATVNGHPLIIEIVGVAGAGKSTLYKFLKERNPKITKVTPPSKIWYAKFLFNCYFRWYPIYLRKYRSDRWFTLKEIRIMGYLETWLPYLRKNAIENDWIITLDPGSIYWLTELKSFGPAIMEDKVLNTWWSMMKSRWVNALDIVIWLDAPTDLLFERVMAREEWHESKELTKEEAMTSFAKFREGYLSLYNQILEVRKNHVYYFRTDQKSTREIADEVCASGWILR